MRSGLQTFLAHQESPVNRTICPQASIVAMSRSRFGAAVESRRDVEVIGRLEDGVSFPTSQRRGRSRGDKGQGDCDSPQRCDGS
jgi:hypothetical protein